MPLDASRDLPDETRCDVLIIGGGPAGSTAATLLAEKGRHVVMLEKDRHPRFHIGESLLPLNLRIFHRLGVSDRIAAIGVHKPGARFVSDEHGKHTAFSFAEGLNPDFTYSYQVRRSEFDEALFARAREAGADAREGVRVLDVALDARGGHRVTARAEDGAMLHFRPRFLMDCSGRDTFLATAMGTKARNPHNNTAAIYGHFRGVAPFGEEEDGNITVHLFDEGWFWMIPLTGGVMSIGVVSNPAFFKRRRGSVEAFFLSTLKSVPSVARRIARAELISEVTTTGNYSYAAKVMQGDGWLMAGDAYAFIDPVFSSGVLLAMASAEMGSEVADTWLDDPARAAAMARTFERKVKRAIGSLSWLIYRINTPVLRDMFMWPSNRFNMKRGLISLLAGDVHAHPDRQVPVLAFKAAYRALTIARRFGYRLGPDGLVRMPRAPAPAPATAG
ncbi:NAD(P)/FAD-dependent oxidoreductase [Roseomonas alkaliterrae]|uniref:Flavin-dependent dehydrogenase n=1 Tax=Neoroseomonas alkaliterrae TaxID=1452450 RepID=A0A840XNL1_9PROT|nr:NAD(P)/FAD-dependent oxidoreductase [Neoroseomonas alkaliterrae]MBB5688340.1 flavin-dependent dehydrogenase [Neoroseomonas alkaliterrae]MBR0678525.1 NAD(P)/FAD-dependent oxidoreductase [Neoroseomonas alkaliterrae]